MRWYSRTPRSAAARGCAIEAEEIFISDGSKCDCGNLQEIFATDIRLAIPDPVYPVYVDTNVMAGRTGGNVDGRYSGVTYLDSTPANGYVPGLPEGAADLIYLCFPNNPTGAVATRAQLEAWVAYAQKNQAIILSRKQCCSVPLLRQCPARWPSTIPGFCFSISCWINGGPLIASPG